MDEEKDPQTGMPLHRGGGMAAAVMAAASVGFRGSMMGPTGRSDPKHAYPDCRKCTLPRCNVKTDHPGGYCCAEHCQEHRSHGRSK